MKTIAETWPIVKGDYTIGNPKSWIAVVTLASNIDPSPEKKAGSLALKEPSLS